MINFQHHNFSKYHDIRYVNFKESFVFQIIKDPNNLNKIIKRTLFFFLKKKYVESMSLAIFFQDTLTFALNSMCTNYAILKQDM